MIDTITGYFYKTCYDVKIKGIMKEDKHPSNIWFSSLGENTLIT